MYHRVGDIDNGGDYACVGAGVFGKSSYILLNFTVKSKTALKKKKK